MAEETQGSIDKLQIEIAASSDEAIKRIKDVTAALKDLQNQVNQRYRNPLQDMGSRSGSGTRTGSRSQRTQERPQPQTQEPVNDSAAQVEEAEQRVSRLRSLLNTLKEKIKLKIDSSDADKATKKVNFLSKLLNDIGRIIKYRAIRSAIKMVTDGFKTGIENLYQFSKATGTQFAASMDKIATSSLYLKNSLGAMVAPIINALAPAIDWLIDRFVDLLNVINQLFAALSGASTWTKAIKYPKEYAEAASGAAKAAKSFTLGIDELNVISDQAGGGGGAGMNYSNMFETAETDPDRMRGVLTVIEAIGAALLAWKLSDTFVGGLKMAVGLFLAINGAVELARTAFDAWFNGLDWDGFWKMISRGAEIVVGLSLAFGRVGAGIGLLVSGITLLVTGFHDAIKSGWNLQNTLATVAGMFSTGLGIAFLVGSWIPALIGAIAGIITAITVATGHGEELIAGVQSVLQGFKDFFTGVFTGDISLAVKGIGSVFEGLKGIVGAVTSGLRDLLNSFFNWLDKQTGGKLTVIFSGIKGIISGFFEWVNNTLAAVIDGAKLVFQGIVEFISGVFTADWNSAWQGVKDVFSGIWNTIVGVLEAAVNIIIKGINFVISKINSISFDVPDWVPGIGGEHFGPHLSLVSEWTAPKFASGGFPDQGQMFIAREAGPELVGNIGGKTAVANNDQIVQGVSNGVAAANAEQNALLREQNQLLQAILSKTGVRIGNKEIKSAYDRATRESGASIMSGGVLA